MRVNVTVLAIISCCSFFFVSCNWKKEPTTQAPSNAYFESSPEYVALKWQELIDKNQFDDAKKLATPEAVKWLDSTVVRFYSAIPQGKEETTVTKFDTIFSKIIDDKAVCYYRFQLEDQTILDSFLLVKKEGKWLIDIQIDNNSQQEIFDDHEIESTSK